MPQDWPEHVSWLATHRGLQLLARLASEHVELDVESALAILVEADPSPGLHGVQWLCDTYIGGGYRWEDVAAGAQSKVAETLGWFSRYRRALPRGQRNLEDHTGLADVYRAVEPLLEPSTTGQFEGDASGRALRRQQRLDAYKDSIVVCNHPDLLVAVPTTRAASQWWGRGTRWCTAADKDNMFDNYNRHAPLIVVVMPSRGGTKLQLNLESAQLYQFMDGADAEVEHGFVHENWDVLGPLVSWAVEHTPTMLGYVPPDLRTPAMYRASVAADGELLASVPRELVDLAMCRDAMQACPHPIRWVPPEYLDEDQCLAAVRWDPELLQCIPTRLRTPAVCRAAVGGSDRALSMLDNPDAELCTYAVRCHGRALRCVPRGVLTQDMCRKAVGQNGIVLAYVPEHWRDAEMCRIAVDDDIAALQYVPHAMQTKPMILGAAGRPGAVDHMAPNLLDDETLLEMVRLYPRSLISMDSARITPALCMEAVGTTPVVLHWLVTHHEDMVDAELCMRAVQAHGLALATVPVGLRTPQMCRLAVQGISTALAYVPAEMLSPELCMIAIQGMAARNMAAEYDAGHKGGQICLLAHLPATMRTVEVCMACMRIDSNSVAHVPSSMWTHRMCAQSIQDNPGLVRQVLAAIPERMHTHSLHSLAVNLCSRNLGQVPVHHRTPELCALAVQAGGRALEHVPAGLRTYDMCVQAVHDYPDAIGSVPPALHQGVMDACMAAGIGIGPQWSPGDLDGLVAVLGGNPVCPEGPGIGNGPRPGG